MSLQSIRSLKNVVIPEGTERIGNKWFWGSRIESIEIPSSVKEIGEYAFCNCKNLKKIIFSENGQLEKISKWCFRSSGLEEVNFPHSVKEIRECAFYECK